MTALGVPRLELWSDLRCNGGARLPVGGFFDASAATLVRSKTGPESFAFSLPRTEEAASVLRENHIATLWHADTDYEEWPVGAITMTQGMGGSLDIVCKPLIQRLATCGPVVEWQTTPVNGLPQLDVGVFQLTLAEIIQTYIIDSPPINAVLPWLTLGTVDSSIPIDLSWSSASPLEVVTAAVSALQAKGAFLWIPPLRRVGNTSYALDVLTDPL